MRRALCLTVLLFLAATLSAGAATTDPPLTVPARTMAAALHCPAGLVHPRHAPVLLVHGTGLTSEQSWAWNYANALPGQGFDVCEVTLPDRALDDIQVAAQYVVWAIRHIASESGRRVDVITHSQGGMEARWAMRWWPTVRAKVDDVVLLASPNHGIAAADGCGDSGSCWPAVWQMRSNAAFIHVLNASSESPGQVSYTNVYSLTDELVEPSSTVPMSGANVANVSVQSLCPGRVVHHAGLLDDAVAYAVTFDALTHPGSADPRRITLAACAQLFMPGVSPAEAAGGNAILYSAAVEAFGGHAGAPKEPPLAAYAR